MRFWRGGIACAVALGLAIAAPASAQTDAAARSNTFTGQCHYAGSIVFEDPLGAVPEENSLRMGMDGTCSGWLDGARVDGEPVWFYGEATGLMSCTQGLPSGTGGLVFDDTVISFTFREYRLTGGGKTQFDGVDGGSLHGVGATDDDTAEQVQSCTEGDGSLGEASIYGDVVGTISG